MTPERQYGLKVKLPTGTRVNGEAVERWRWVWVNGNQWHTNRLPTYFKTWQAAFEAIPRGSKFQFEVFPI